MTAMRQFIGEILRALRLERDLTLRELSALAQVSISYISEVERGHKEPSSELLAALASALDVPLSSVLFEVSRRLEVEESVELAPVRSIAPGAVKASAA